MRLRAKGITTFPLWDRFLVLYSNIGTAFYYIYYNIINFVYRVWIIGGLSGFIRI